jgi:hypothetical protein
MSAAVIDGREKGRNSAFARTFTVISPNELRRTAMAKPKDHHHR